MDRLFTIAYLPVCLLLLGVTIKFNSIPGRPRILTSFAAFTLIMLTLPLVSDLTPAPAAVDLRLWPHQRCQRLQVQLPAGYNVARQAPWEL